MCSRAHRSLYYSSAPPSFPVLTLSPNYLVFQTGFAWRGLLSVNLCREISHRLGTCLNRPSLGLGCLEIRGKHREGEGERASGLCVARILLLFCDPAAAWARVSMQRMVVSGAARSKLILREEGGKRLDGNPLVVRDCAACLSSSLHPPISVFVTQAPAPVVNPCHRCRRQTSHLPSTLPSVPNPVSVC